MQADNIGNLSQFLAEWKSNEKYFNILRQVAQLSKLYSENTSPFIHYRLAENIFCKYFSARNKSRECTAYDALLGELGVGVKTFVLKGKNEDYSLEKIAEFDKNSNLFNGLKGKALAVQLATLRNERMQLADTLYNTKEAQYHIVGRAENKLRIFNTPYELIDIDNIHVVHRKNGFVFEDGKNEYSFNRSKSTLLKKFRLPSDHIDIDVDIIENPLSFLEEFFAYYNGNIGSQTARRKGYDYVILPLYSYSKNKGKYVSERSGLNQFNAGGRKRNPYEVYIPIPQTIHKLYPDFFPSRKVSFELRLPDGSSMSAKVCQDGGKALMSNPNSKLGEWVLKTIFNKKEWELVTIDDLDRKGFDSICVEKLHLVNENGEAVYQLSFSSSNESYGEFIE